MPGWAGKGMVMAGPMFLNNFSAGGDGVLFGNAQGTELRANN
jgi:hypothetical protein